jgi:hypothetical protein
MDKKFAGLCKAFFEASADRRKAVIHMYCHIKETAPGLAEQLVAQGTCVPSLHAANAFLSMLLDVHAKDQ